MNPHGAHVFSIYSPPDRQVKATCEQVKCGNWANGFECHIDEATPLGAEQACFIRRHSGRTFTEQRTGTGITVFRFEAGQRCFAEHHTRPERFTERVTSGGGRLTAQPRVHSASGWVDAMDTHLHKLKEVLG